MVFSMVRSPVVQCLEHGAGLFPDDCAAVENGFDREQRKTRLGEAELSLGAAGDRGRARFMVRSAGLGKGSDNQSEDAQGAGLRSLAHYRELVQAQIEN